MSKKTFASNDEQIAYYQEEIAKLERRAQIAVGRNKRSEIRAEIERLKCLIRHLRKLEKGRIQHANMGKSITEEIEDG